MTRRVVNNIPNTGPRPLSDILVPHSIGISGAVMTPFLAQAISSHLVQRNQAKVMEAQLNLDEQNIEDRIKQNSLRVAIQSGRIMRQARNAISRTRAGVGASGVSVDSASTKAGLKKILDTAQSDIRASRRLVDMEAESLRRNQEAQKAIGEFNIKVKKEQALWSLLSGVIANPGARN